MKAKCHEHAYGELDCHWGDCDWEGQQTPYCPCCGKDHYLHRSWDAEQQEAWRAALAALEDGND